MLEQPDIQPEKITACLQHEYGLRAGQITFLPLGADVNAAVYQIIADDNTPYFFKLKTGVFDETSVALPRFLSDKGITQIIPPLATRTGQLWGKLDVFTTILYPFIDGRNGYEVNLSDRHWHELGTALKKIHTIEAPPGLTNHIRQETYSPQAREAVKNFLECAETGEFDEPVAKELAAFLHTKQTEILDLVQRAEQFAQILQDQAPEVTVCHSDIHAGNILLATNDTLYIVDWDEPILAPKERDLMYIGGGLLASGRSPQEEETLFYRTYGHTQINFTALAYYRYERIVQDITAYCEQLLLTDAGGEDRAQSLYYVKSNFLPDGTIDIAYQSDKTHKGREYDT